MKFIIIYPNVIYKINIHICSYSMPTHFLALRSSANARRVNKKRQQLTPSVSLNAKQNMSGESNKKNTFLVTPHSDATYTVDTDINTLKAGGSDVSADVISEEQRKPRTRTRSAFELLAEQAQLDEAAAIAAEKKEKNARKSLPTSGKKSKSPSVNNNPGAVPTSSRANKRKVNRAATIDQVANKSPKKSVSNKSIIPRQLTVSALTFLKTDIGDDKFQVDHIKDTGIQPQGIENTQRKSFHNHIPVASKSVFTNSPKSSDGIKAISKIITTKNIKKSVSFYI